MQTNDFSKSIDKVLSGTYPRHDFVMVSSKTPQLIQDIGFKDLPIMITQKHINSCMAGFDKNLHYHGLSKDVMLSLENDIRSPVIIIKSNKNKDRVIIVTNKLDKNKDPIIAILQSNGLGTFNGKYTEFNVLNSVYGKENFGNFLNNAIQNNELMFYDKEKSRGLLRQVGNSYPKELTNYDSNTIIRYLNENVNPLDKKTLENKKNIEKADEECGAGEAVIRQMLLELGKSKEVAEKDAKLLLPLAEAQLEQDLAKEGKRLAQPQAIKPNVAEKPKANINNNTNKNNENKDKK